LGALVLVLPVALGPYDGEARRLALLAALHRFSRLAVACVGVVVATGIYSALNWIYKPSDMTYTAFGGALILKGVLVLGLLLLGLAHHAALQPERYRRWHNILVRIGGFIPTLRLESLLALSVIASAGLLSATPVPIPDFVKTNIPSPSATTLVGDLAVTQTLTPGGPGANTYDMLITRNGQPVDGLKVDVQLSNPARDWRGHREGAEAAGTGLYVAAGDDIDREGQWWSLVDVTLPDGRTARAAFNWQITNDAAIIQSRPPSILSILALFGVVLTAGWAIYPLARRFYQRLDLRPMTVTIAVGAALATVFLIVLSFVYLQNTQTQYEVALNPPPKVVNPVLPDAESLKQGQQVYAEHCTGWSGNDLNQLLVRLARVRDEELFALVRDGGQGLSPCDLSITDQMRWDVVNFIRTQAES
jgi:hypothetical protein